MIYACVNLFFMLCTLQGQIQDFSGGGGGRHFLKKKSGAWPPIVFVEDLVKRCPQEISHEATVRVLRAEGVRV